MDDYYHQIENLLKIQYELDTGTYKRMPNKERLDLFNRDLKQFQKNYNKDNIMLNQTCTTDSKVGNTNKSFNNNMKPITIKDMTLGTTYKNRYITFEIVTELILMTSIMFLGKDVNEDLVLIAVYNFEKHYGTKNYKKLSYIFQKGKYILVFEPFYKMFGSGEDGIRIEDPNEIIIFDDKEWLNKFLKEKNQEESFKLYNDEEDKNYDELYIEAYKSLSIENYNTALVHFIKLKSLKPDEIKFDLTIAECYFSIPYYSKCIEKCDEYLNKNNNNNIITDEKDKDEYYSKFLLLKIKSLFKLKKIYEAKEIIYEIKEDIFDKNKYELINIKEDLKNKIKNMNGEFNFNEIYKKSKESLNIDIGEYINKKLEIKFIPNKGISIYTKIKITKGELLVVSKALAISDPNKKEERKAQYMNFDNPDREDKEECKKAKFGLICKPKGELEEILSYNLSNHLEDYSDFLYLFDGKNKNMNLEQRYKNKNIDLRKIQNVIKYNSQTLYFSELPISKGLWYYPSLFNHSCIPNCYHFGFGDILIIIAINDIEPNSELFLSYFYNDMLYDKRQSYIKDLYNFDCNCELCKYERNKLKECDEKKTLEEYLQRLHDDIFGDISDGEIKIKNKLLTKKDIENMIKFIEKNKKIFSCYEKSNLYLKSAHLMRFYDPYLSYEYLEKSLKYSENRNYYFEKLTLFMMSQVAKQLKSDMRIQFVSNKFREFWEKYFPNQKKFAEMLLEEYLK